MTNPPHDVSAPPQGGLINSIEQFDAVLTALDANDCPNTRVPWMMATNNSKRAAVIFRPRCKLWSCPVCSKSNAWAWAFKANYGAHELYDRGQSLDFIAITSHEKLSPQASWWVAPKAWMKLQARIRRATGGFEYFAVPEVQKNGRVHFHLITTAKLSKKWWKDNARACGFGFQSDRQEVHDLGGVVGYMAKYLTKSLELSQLPKGTRRVRVSRGYPRTAPRQVSDDWDFAIIPRHEPLQGAYEALERRGYFVTMKGSKSAWRFVEAISDHASNIFDAPDA